MTTPKPKRNKRVALVLSDLEYKWLTLYSLKNNMSKSEVLRDYIKSLAPTNTTQDNADLSCEIKELISKVLSKIDDQS